MEPAPDFINICKDCPNSDIRDDIAYLELMNTSLAQKAVGFIEETLDAAECPGRGEAKMFESPHGDVSVSFCQNSAIHEMLIFSAIAAQIRLKQR